MMDGGEKDGDRERDNKNTTIIKTNHHFYITRQQIPTARYLKTGE
jgi:hypothetical protein